MNEVCSERLLERFCRYVQVDTTADPASTTYPSSAGQLALGAMLAEELRSMGLVDVGHDRHGIVLATLPASDGRREPAVAWVAHVDTSADTSGTGVKPQVWRDYDGRDLVLPGDPRKVIRVAENPELAELVGQTIITSDGATLLGADDKSGIAAIMEAVHWLAEHPEWRRAAVRVVFTCDEEIGHGVDHLDVPGLRAAAAYTLDGGGRDMIDVETFSADLAEVTFHGVNIHPSIALGRMHNAIKAAAAFVEKLPHDRLAPELTSERQGFVHPYHLAGGVAEARLKVLLRDFDTARLAEHAELLRAAARETETDWPGVRIEVQVTPQYRNLADVLDKHPAIVERAEEAFRRCGRTPERTIIRGGTDGSLMSHRGLPTPNLSTGEHNPHSPLEWTCLEEMTAAAAMLIELAQVWGE